MRNKQIWLAASLALTILLSGCASAGTDDIDNIGFHSVVYDVNNIGPNKYTLESTTTNGVTDDELLKVYKARAAKLCQPKIPTLRYKISTETYMGTFNASMKLPMTAPKIIGIVTCK